MEISQKFLYPNISKRQAHWILYPIIYPWTEHTQPQLTTNIMTSTQTYKLTAYEAEAAIISFQKIISYPTVSSTAASSGGTSEMVKSCARRTSTHHTSTALFFVHPSLQRMRCLHHISTKVDPLPRRHRHFGGIT